MLTTRLRRTLGVALVPALLALLAPAGAAAATDDAPCEDLLVEHRPDRSAGHAAAVAITSQVLVADQPGWEAAGWEAADGVEVRTVVVTAPDGSISERPGGTSGDLGPTLAAAFCGTDITTVDASATTLAPPFAPPTEGGGIAAVGLLGAIVGGVLAGLVLLASRADRHPRGGSSRSASGRPRRTARSDRPSHREVTA